MIGGDRFAGKLSHTWAALHATQRYRQGFSDVDMWNFDCFLADVIAAGCQWQIDHGLSAPTGMSREKWVKVLGEIRDGFTAEHGDLFPVPPKRAWKLLRKNFQYLWD